MLPVTVLLFAFQSLPMPFISDHHMRDTLYKEIVRLLNRHRSWLEPTGSGFVRKHTVLRNGKMTEIQCRVLVVRAIYQRTPYLKGQEWQIPEYEIRQAVKLLRSDKGFRRRMNDGKPSLQDVENIIIRATHGILKPQLSDFPIFTCLTDYD